MKVNSLEVPGINEQECENIKETLTKYGQKVVCDDEDVLDAADLVLPGGDGCETAKEVASKYGYKVVCEDEEEVK